MKTNDRAMKVKTDMTAVRIFTDAMVVEGNAHIKPGSYAGRVSDVLNRTHTNFLPITEARYRLTKSESTEYLSSSCLLVNIADIVLLDVLDS